MLNVASLIDTLLSDNTTLTSTYSLVIKEDEFDPRSPALQLLIENFPETKEWIADGIYKILHRCRLTLFLKPIRYAEADITSAKTKFYECKDVIDIILDKNKFNITGITNLDLSKNGWNDKNSLRVGRGTKDMGTFFQSRGGQDVNIVFRSETIITCIYYIAYSLEN